MGYIIAFRTRLQRFFYRTHKHEIGGHGDENLPGCVGGPASGRSAPRSAVRSTDRLRRSTVDRDGELIHEFIDVGEFVLSLEQIADVLAEDERALTDDERVEVLALVEEMGMDDRVPSAVGRCPRAPGL